MVVLEMLLVKPEWHLLLIPILQLTFALRMSLVKVTSPLERAEFRIWDGTLSDG
jgi:hypothetical protein